MAKIARKALNVPAPEHYKDKEASGRGKNENGNK